MFDTSDLRFLLRLHFGARLPMSNDVYERIGQGLVEYEKRWPRRPVDLLGAAEHDGNVLIYHLTMALEEEDEEKYIDADMEIIQHFGESIRSRRTARLTREFDAIQGILSLIGSIGHQNHLHCQMSNRMSLHQLKQSHQM